MSRLLAMLNPTTANLISVVAGLLFGALAAPIIYTHYTDWRSRQEFVRLQTDRILDARWKVVRRTSSSISVSAWGIRYRSPECVFIGIEAVVVSPEGVAMPAVMSRPGGIGPRGTLPEGLYDAGVWTVELPVEPRSVIATARYECRSNGVVAYARAVLFHIPPETYDGSSKTN